MSKGRACSLVDLVLRAGCDHILAEYRQPVVTEVWRYDRPRERSDTCAASELSLVHLVEFLGRRFVLESFK